MLAVAVVVAATLDGVCVLEGTGMVVGIAVLFLSVAVVVLLGEADLLVVVVELFAEEELMPWFVFVLPGV